MPDTELPGRKSLSNVIMHELMVDKIYTSFDEIATEIIISKAPQPSQTCRKIELPKRTHTHT